VKFAATTADTANAGEYMAQWRVVFANGSVMTFPTVGYLSVSIEENLTTAGGQQLVSVPDVKDYLNIVADDRTHDAKLARFIRAARPIVENITGPIIQAAFDEWHDGGSTFIQVRRRPSSSFATTPVLTLTNVDEYRGPVKFPLTVVAEPSLGTTYSCMIDGIGTITRRTAGGGVTAFYPGPGSVRVRYTAGQSSIPPNVYEATLEAIRVNYQTTQQAGRGRLTVSDDQDSGPPLGFYLPRRCRELLAPNRRAPSVG
jgi:hypothetical protein